MTDLETKQAAEIEQLNKTVALLQERIDNLVKWKDSWKGVAQGTLKQEGVL